MPSPYAIPLMFRKPGQPGYADPSASVEPPTPAPQAQPAPAAPTPEPVLVSAPAPVAVAPSPAPIAAPAPDWAPAPEPISAPKPEPAPAMELALAAAESAPVLTEPEAASTASAPAPRKRTTRTKTADAAPAPAPSKAKTKAKAKAEPQAAPKADTPAAPRKRPSRAKAAAKPASPTAETAAPVAPEAAPVDVELPVAVPESPSPVPTASEPAALAEAPTPAPVAAPTVTPPPVVAPAVRPSAPVRRQNLDWAAFKQSQGFTPAHAAEWLAERTPLLPLNSEQALRLAQLMQPLELSVGSLRPASGAEAIPPHELLLVLRGSLLVETPANPEGHHGTPVHPAPADARSPAGPTGTELASIGVGDFWDPCAFLHANGQGRQVVAHVQRTVAGVVMTRQALSELANEQPDLAARFMATVCQDLSRLVRANQRRVAEGAQWMRQQQGASSAPPAPSRPAPAKSGFFSRR